MKSFSVEIVAFGQGSTKSIMKLWSKELESPANLSSIYPVGSSWIQLSQTFMRLLRDQLEKLLHGKKTEGYRSPRLEQNFERGIQDVTSLLGTPL